MHPTLPIFFSSRGARRGARGNETRARGEITRGHLNCDSNRGNDVCAQRSVSANRKCAIRANHRARFVEGGASTAHCAKQLSLSLFFYGAARPSNGTQLNPVYLSIDSLFAAFGGEPCSFGEINVSGALRPPSFYGG